MELIVYSEAYVMSVSQDEISRAILYTVPSGASSLGDGHFESNGWVEHYAFNGNTYALLVQPGGNAGFGFAWQGISTTPTLPSDVVSETTGTVDGIPVIIITRRDGSQTIIPITQTNPTDSTQPSTQGTPVAEITGVRIQDKTTGGWTEAYPEGRTANIVTGGQAYVVIGLANNGSVAGNIWIEVKDQIGNFIVQRTTYNLQVGNTEPVSFTLTVNKSYSLTINVGH